MEHGYSRTLYKTPEEGGLAERPRASTHRLNCRSSHCLAIYKLLQFGGYTALAFHAKYHSRLTIADLPYASHKKIVLAYKKDANLKDLLCRSRFPDPRHLTHTLPIAGPHVHGSGQVRRCVNVKCKACSYIIETKGFESSVTKRQFMQYKSFTCKSSNVIYLVTCAFCKKLLWVLLQIMFLMSGCINVLL